jgi:cytochrome c-type biogenesis protein CcmH
MIDDLKKNSGIQSDTPPVTNNDQAEQPSVVTAASIQVSVSLDDSLKDKVAADDVLFIMAKAVSGPPMPLAAVKLKGSDLPADVKLDDSMAMMPQLKLSGFDKVLVQARIAKGGKPIAQSGDLQSASVEVATSAQAAIALVINSEVP